MGVQCHFYYSKIKKKKKVFYELKVFINQMAVCNLSAYKLISDSFCCLAENNNFMEQSVLRNYHFFLLIYL